MATLRVLLFLISIRSIVIAKLYPIVLFNDTYLENDICYMKNVDNRNHHYCESIASEMITFPRVKTCVLNNESLPILDNRITIDKWIDQSIKATNCSYFLLASTTREQKRILTIAQSVLLVILFLPFSFELILLIIQYYF